MPAPESANSEAAAQPLTVKFTLSADEALGGQRMYYRFFASAWQRFNYRYLAAIGVLLLLGGANLIALQWLFRLNLSLWLNLFLVFYGAYLILWRTVIWPRKIKKEFAKYPGFDEDRVVIFTDGKISGQTSHSKTEMDWSRYARFVETDNLFVLFAPPRAMSTIPKRVLSAGETDQLRDLLQRKLPEACRRKR